VYYCNNSNGRLQLEVRAQQEGISNILWKLWTGLQRLSKVKSKAIKVTGRGGL
jgi:hypothetical protein